MKKIFAGLFISAAMLIAGSAMAETLTGPQSSAITLDNPVVAYAYFIDDTHPAPNGADVTSYSINTDNNTGKFAITVGGDVQNGAGTGSATANIALGTNSSTGVRISFAFAKGTLPGNWTAQFDGAPAGQPVAQTYQSVDAGDLNRNIVIPMTLTVDGIGLDTKAGSTYSGTVSISSIAGL